ncbi:hypothetical protein ACOME3_006354 [Neoechinorhynchus agilis]
MKKNLESDDTEDLPIKEWISRVGPAKVPVLIEEDKKQSLPQYVDEKCLKGLEVGHNANDFIIGQSVILTLKDVQVLDDAEDILENVNMVEAEKAEKRAKFKKLPSQGYNPYDAGDCILAKYDEVIEGGQKRKVGFVIGNEDVGSKTDDDSGLKKTGALESLAFKLTQASDYLSNEEVLKFKRPKKKAKKVKERYVSEEQVTVNKSENVKIAYEQDDDVFVRRKLEITQLDNKRKCDLSFNKIERQVIETNEEFNDDVLVLNTVNEFCQGIGQSSENEKHKPISSTVNTKPSGSSQSIKFQEVYHEASAPEMMIEHVTDNGVFDEEPILHSGLSAALQLVRTKGYLDGEKDRQKAQPVNKTILSGNWTIDDRCSYDIEDKFSRKERNVTSSQLVEFKERPNYKPNVTLEYMGENGRKMNEKEAFRYLSHRFHGKGSGKKKTEKRLVKFKEEESMMKMTSTDTPLNTVTLLHEKQKQLNQPYIVLSANKKDLEK